MIKPQYIYLVAILLILSGNTTSISAQITPRQDRFAQNSSSDNISDDDEMLELLQQRQNKIEQNLDKLNKLTGADSPDSEVEAAPLSDDQMIDALNQRQQKIEELKELKQVKERLKKESTLNSLQEQNFNINSLEELEIIQEIINQDLDRQEMLDALREQNFNVDSWKKLAKLRKIVKKNQTSVSNSSEITPQMAFRMLTIGIPATILVCLIATPLIKGLTKVVKDNYQEKFGKPNVPQGSIDLHSRSFQEITKIGNKAEKINHDKFGSEEFLLLLRIKIKMMKKAEGYQGLSNCVDLLQAGIIAQKSFLRLEQTELRYRSRKQQEFYQYIADNLTDDLNREAFAQKVKQKQTDVLPLITTEEGRAAINTYAKEIDILSKYKLGLKLLALFKQYELQDFSILKNISDVVDTLAGKDLISSDDLVSPVLENYESFEKLAPILGLSAAESTPQAYAKILQVIGLNDRHGKAYLEFAQLVELLKKWEKLYKAIALVRKEYTDDKYSIPAEFKLDIPGVKVYQRYAEYLSDL